jgi:hypothetical protein
MFDAVLANLETIAALLQLNIHLLLFLDQKNLRKYLILSQVCCVHMREICLGGGVSLSPRGRDTRGSFRSGTS